MIDERKVCTNTTASTICYFFFKDGQEQRTRGANALSALLHQLFENTALITHALPTFSRYGKKLRDEFTELWEILLKSAADPQAGDIICVLDALDECEENARNQLMDKLFYFISQEIYQHPSLKLKFLVTSRPYDRLELKFKPLSTFSTYMRFDGDEKSWMIGQEINLVIDAKIPHIAGGFDQEERKRICDRLKGMKNRTYLWLFLTIDIIEKSPSNFRRKSEIDSLLSNLPSEISDAYGKILERSTDERKARILLKIIVAATRPLDLEEANMALAIATREGRCHTQREVELWPLQNFKSDVQNWCGLFVSVHDGKLSLIHQTAREFLTKTSKSASSSLHKWQGRLDIADAHGTMSRICLNYLQFEDVAGIDERQLTRDGSRKPWGGFFRKPTGDYHLLNYAAKHWTTHYNSQAPEFVKTSLDAAVSLCNMPSARGWFLACCNFETRYTSEWTYLGIASRFGLVNVVEKFLDKGADVNAKCSGYGNALYTATRYGHDQLVQLLLDNGATDVDGKVLRAASYDHMLRMLLDNGATDVDGRALRGASYQGHDHIVRMLLDKRREYYVQHSDVLNFVRKGASSYGPLQEFQRSLG